MSGIARQEFEMTLAEPRTVPSAVLQEAFPTSTGYPPKASVWDKWLADLTPRGEREEVKSVQEEIGSPDVVKEGTGGSWMGESRSCVRTQADDAAGPRRNFVDGKENAVANIVEEKKPEARDVAVKKEPGVLRGRRVLSMDGNMCTLSLFERGGEVRVEAAMRIGGKLLRGGCEVPDATTDAWAVWARTDVRVLDSALSVAYT
jgi:hypothetical protein